MTYDDEVAQITFTKAATVFGTLILFAAAYGGIQAGNMFIVQMLILLAAAYFFIILVAGAVVGILDSLNIVVVSTEAKIVLHLMAAVFVSYLIKESFKLF